MSDIPKLFTKEQLKQLKSECGGLQTLLKLHWQVFVGTSNLATDAQIHFSSLDCVIVSALGGVSPHNWQFVITVRGGIVKLREWGELSDGVREPKARKKRQCWLYHHHPGKEMSQDLFDKNDDAVD